uniref:Leucine-rich repeat-containing N-terminal plant-type domain-containing protein n=1 Tax=Oryza punctata TaxID=4537 RepID=A0A0E0KXW9_ORYPU
MKLNGTFPAAIGKLTMLVNLQIAYNGLTSPLPSLAKLDQLQSLRIEGSTFAGPGLVPADFFTGLGTMSYVNLGNNPFSAWSFPDSLQLAKPPLINFSVDSCILTGRIPQFLATFAQRTFMSLANNKITGTVPVSLGLAPPVVLCLQNQTLFGTIEFAANLGNVQTLRLDGNNFNGRLPDFSNLTELEEIYLNNNKFTRLVPTSLLNLGKLTKVTLSENLLQGPVSSFSSKLTDVNNAPVTNSYCLPSIGDCDPRVIVLLLGTSSVRFPRVVGVLIYQRWHKPMTREVIEVEMIQVPWNPLASPGLQITFEIVERATGGFNDTN